MTKPLNIGVDMDGVLADFNEAFIDRIIQVTGRDLFPERPFPIPTWNYPQHFGYTETEVALVWEDIKMDSKFWRNLSPYEGTIAALTYLRRLELQGHRVWFITARLGNDCLNQTIEWLRYWVTDRYREAWAPSVIISSLKGPVAFEKQLDAYIDDRWENCEDVKRLVPQCVVFLMDRPWNEDAPNAAHGIIRTNRLLGIAVTPVQAVA